MSVREAWLIADTGAEAGALETLPDTPGLVVLSRDRYVTSDLRFDNGERVCINSEAAMADVVGRLDAGRRRAIGILKDKHAFRQALQTIYPDFFFAETNVEDLPFVRLDPDRRYVVKPARGCFGTGVRIIGGDADLRALREAIENEVARNAAVLSASVLSSGVLIIEQYIEGEEYAVDMFFDSSGQPVITNAYHHPMPANPAYLHMVYYSSRSVFELLFEPAMAFLKQLNELLDIRGLPLHCEFRMERGRLIPIEINSMRFGGMGLANLGYYASGVNAYEHFIADTAPDWPSILAQTDDAAIFFIAYNGANTDPAMHRPDWPRLERQFSEILHKVKFDHRAQLAFGVLYAREPLSRIPELLSLEFDDFFVSE